MRLAIGDGLSLHVQELGSGPPVVMLHGLLFGNVATWYFSAAPALARRHRVILYDLRGHGLSARAASGYDVATLAGDLGQVIERVAGEPVALVGHSYGGTVALELALRAPERVRRLALVEAPLPASRLAELGTPAELEARLQAARANPAALDGYPDLLRGLVIGGGRRARRFLDAWHALGETSILADLGRAEDVPDAALARLGCPLLAVYGAASSCRAVGARLGRVVPGARHVELAGGHFLPLEAPAALTAELERFL